ncbi:MAG: hypothetical protein AAF729_04655 [Pseudomonadota bacterium]
MKSLPLLAILATPIFAIDAKAANLKVECGHQAQLVSAITKARLDGVRERDVSDHLLKGDITWPERYNPAITPIAGWVYQQKMRDVRTKDLAAGWQELCLKQ